MNSNNSVHMVLDKYSKLKKIFLAFDFCRFCVVIRFFHPYHKGQWPRISIPDFIHYIYFPMLILEKEPVFSFWMFSAKQGHYWYHFITSLVWRSPWLGIEPGTSRTRSQHYTTRHLPMFSIYHSWRSANFRSVIHAM